MYVQLPVAARVVEQRSRLVRRAAADNHNRSRWVMYVQLPVAARVVEQRLPAPHHRSPVKMIMQILKVLLHMMEHKQIFNRSVAK